MPLSAGTRLGPYEVLAPIGAGGMGEVYRARDTKLDRDVAIKVLPAALAQDPERLARFEREAKVLAALNHPNIAQIYGVEESGGVRALVMELVPGEPLKGPLPLETALNYAKQIADALEAAHEKGIVHRDLKPANIMITPAGVVKVLDFGLAAVPGQGDSGADPSISPTLTVSPTRAGMILGTAAYMGPEQARGQAVDRRADIWAFGVVLYEMVTGKRLFQGEDLTETLASVVKEEPRFDQAPPKVRRLLRKCLEKDPKRRLRDIGDAWELLESEADEGVGRGPGGPPHKRWLAWVVAAVLAVALGVVLWAPWRTAPPAPEVKRYQIPVKIGERRGPFVEFAVSPDGRRLAYETLGGNGRVSQFWLQSLDSIEARAVPGWEVTRPTGAPVYPFWSPDSQYLAFASGGKLKKARISGGPPQTICDVTMRLSFSGSWNGEGVILFSDGGAISRVSDTGGTPSPLVAPHGAEKRGGYFPFFLPDGRHFLYYGSTSEGSPGAVDIGSIDAKPETQDMKPLLAADSAAIFAPDSDQSATLGATSGGSGSEHSDSQRSGSERQSSGYVLFTRDRTLLAQRFDAKRLQLVGEAVPLADPVGRFLMLPSFSVSTNGVLMYHPGVQSQQSQLTLLDRKGNATGTLGEPGTFGASVFSPDGKRVALTITDYTKSTNAYDLWISDLRGFRTRLTFGGVSHSPVWSPDARRVAFAREGKMYWKAADGAGDEEPLASVGENPSPTGWSPDGRYILYDVRTEGQNGYDIWVLPLPSAGGDSKPYPFLNTPANERGGIFSPDGRWVAYASNETGSNEVWVRPFPPSKQGKWLVSKGGVSGTASWPRDGKELHYVAPDGSVIVVPVTANPVFQAGEPTVLFKRPANAGILDAAPGLKTFLAVVPVAAAASAPEPFTVVLNWMSLLKPRP
jgi:Tol biopolymer transport system component